MSDLVAFLRARLDEDEAAARAAAAGPDWFLGSSEDCDQRSVRYTGPSTLHEGQTWDYCVADRVDVSDAAHIARHDPARVLREVEAKRRHLDQYRMAAHACQIARPDEANSLAGYRDATYGTLRADASVWSDHPDYDPEWKP